MNRAIVAVPILLLAASMSFVAMAQATNWEVKNNDKFETFSVQATMNFINTVVLGQHEYYPSFDKVNKMIITMDETFITYKITVDGKTYEQGKDFSYTGFGKWVFYDPVFSNPALKYYPSEQREVTVFVDYCYDFSAYQGGLDGVIHLRAVSTPSGHMSVNSLSGTEDFQNVQVKAGAWGSYSAPIYSIFHEGIVLGWPE